MSVHIHQNCTSTGLGSHPHAIQHFLKSRTDSVSSLNQTGSPYSHFRVRRISLLADLKHERTFFDCQMWHPLVSTLCNTGYNQWNAQHTRDIQKISSVCEYCRCSAAVTMVRMRAEFLDSLLRHGRNLQKSEQCLRIVLCVYNV